jgi:hypothetical protein
MAQNKKDELKPIEFAFQALITEYQSMRETILSRDQFRSTLLNYMVALLTASLIVFDSILANRLFFSFLIFSIMFSALGSVYIFNSKLNTYLLYYEHSVLRKRLEDAIKRAGEIAGTEFEYKVWQWQEWYRRLTLEENKFDGTMNLLSFGLPNIVPILGSLGLLFAFVYLRPLSQSTAVEIILVITASLFDLVFIVSIQAGVSGARLWSEVNSLRKKRAV